MNGGTNNLLPEIHQIASGTGWFIASYSEQIIKTTLCASTFQTYRKPDISWKRFAFQHKNHKGRQRIGLRKDGQGNLLHPRSHPHCNQAAPCVCASVQPPHQTGQRCGSIGCSFSPSSKGKARHLTVSSLSANYSIILISYVEAAYSSSMSCPSIASS